MYGDANGLDSPRLEVLDDTVSTTYNGYLQVADLNGDGWLDVVVTLSDQDRLLVCWNSASGFSPTGKSFLETDNPCGVRIADLNKDGHLDVVAVSEVNMKKRPTDRRPMYIGDPRTAMDIFWGGKGGYSSLRTTKLPTVGADDCTIADLNGDGWLDIAVTSYHSGDHRHHPGYIYWNSRDGFSESCRDLIPMNAGCGILAVDLNRDGYQDLVWANHTIVGNHRSYVSVAYGSADGLGLNEALKLPAFGPHYFNFADIGNVFDRSARFDYVSPAFDAGPGVRFDASGGRPIPRSRRVLNCRFARRPPAKPWKRLPGRDRRAARTTTGSPAQPSPLIRQGIDGCSTRRA